jgi:tetratricopeptide (TPR) repeat protein
MAAFSRAVQLRPDYADAYYARGLVYESLGDFDRSLADLEKVLRLRPGVLQVGSGMGQTSIPEGFLLEPCRVTRLPGRRRA